MNPLLVWRQRIPRRWWFIVGAVLLLTLGAVATWAYLSVRNFDAESARAFLTENISSATGRVFTVRGPIELHVWSLRPAIVATDVSLANPAWASQPNFVHARRFAAELDLLALLGGTLRINHVAFDQPQVILETDSKGRGNWVFQSKAASHATTASPAKSGLTFEVESLSIDQGVVSFRSGVDATGWKLDLNLFRASGKTRTDPQHVKLEAHFNEHPFTITGSLDSFLGLFEATVATGVDLTLRAGKTTVNAKGTVASLFDASGLDAQVTIKGEKFGELARYFSYEPPDLGRYRATGRLHGSVYAPALRNLVFTMDERDGVVALTSRGQVADLVKLRGLDVTFTAYGVELADLLRRLGIEQPKIGPFRVAGRVHGTVPALVLDNIDFTLGDPALNGLMARGRIARLADLNGTELVVSGRFEDVRRATERFGLHVPALPATIDVKIVQRDDTVTLSNIRLRLGESDIAGELALKWRPRIDNVRAKLHGDLIDLAELQPDRWRPEQTPASAQPLPQGRYFSDAAIDWSWLHQGQFDIDLALTRLAIQRDLAVHQLVAHVALQDGRLTAVPVRMRLAPDGSDINARLMLTHSRDAPLNVEAMLATSNLDVTPLLVLAKKPAAYTGGLVEFNADLRAHGNSVSALMGSLDGQVRVAVGQALLDKSLFDFGADLLTEFVTAVMPFVKNDATTKLECIAVRLPVRDGIVTIDRSVALQTAKVNIVSSGVVNLKAETLNLYMQAQAREGLSLGLGKVTNMFKITGTLAKPSYGVSAEGVIEAGITTAAAVSTAGLSILVEGLATKALRDRKPCLTALKP